MRCQGLSSHRLCRSGDRCWKLRLRSWMRGRRSSLNFACRRASSWQSIVSTWASRTIGRSPIQSRTVADGWKTPPPSPSPGASRADPSRQPMQGSLVGRRGLASAAEEGALPEPHPAGCLSAGPGGRIATIPDSARPGGQPVLQASPRPTPRHCHPDSPSLSLGIWHITAH